MGNEISEETHVVLHVRDADEIIITWNYLE